MVQEIETFLKSNMLHEKITGVVGIDDVVCERVCGQQSRVAELIIL